MGVLVRRTVVVGLLAVLGSLVVPAAPSNAADVADADIHVISTGTFIGFVNMDCDQSPIARFTCSVDGHSTLCLEVVAGTEIGGSCSATFSGSIEGVGTSLACVGFGPGDGGADTVGPGYSHAGLITQEGTTGNYSGSGDAGATGIFVEAEWATTGCGTPLVDGPMTGTFVTTPSP